MFKILSGKKYRNMLSEQKQLQERYHELEKEIKTLEEEKEQLLETKLEQEEELEERSTSLIELSENYKGLQIKLSEIEERTKENIDSVVDETIKGLGLNRTQIEKLQSDRKDLIQLYINKLYSLARHFAMSSR